jgi:hypothetical protein
MYFLLFVEASGKNKARQGKAKQNKTTEFMKVKGELLGR